jgi:hypothetical protein
MFKIIFILIIYWLSIGNISAMNQIKKCKDCRWFINKNNDLCSLFSITNNNKPEFNLASECRNNPFLCGTNPWFYSSKNSKQIESNIDKTVINK